ncbi:MAG: hypothetical protein M3335_00355 [Actinomycetota bacterium]|nr:hypothetical protein [Actinomycetota bacterium]
MAALLLLVIGAGCGGGGDSTTDSASDDQASRPYPWLKGPSREFLVPEGDNVVQTYGREAPEAEREEVSRTIEAWMKARAAGQRAVECKYLDPNNVESTVKAASFQEQRKVTSCGEGLSVLSRNGYRGPPANNMTGPIDSLRIGEGRGYAQYHGNDGRDWIVPVRKVDGEWKISSLDPIDRMK